MKLQTSQTAAALTVEELAAQIKYHPESVRRAIRQGRINALRFGAGWRIPAPEVVRILTTGLPFSTTTAERLTTPAV